MKTNFLLINTDAKFLIFFNRTSWAANGDISRVDINHKKTTSDPYINLLFCVKPCKNTELGNSDESLNTRG